MPALEPGPLGLGRVELARLPQPGDHPASSSWRRLGMRADSHVTSAAAPGVFRVNRRERGTMPSTSTFRIPKAQITGLYGAMMKLFAKRMLGGEFPDDGYVYFHHKPVLKAVMSFEGKVEKWDALDPNLKSYAQLASAGVIGCSWCLDFGYFKAHNDGLDLAKVREVPRWRESDVFTPLERDVLEYAEAMTVTPPTVTDEMVARLVDQLGAPAVVELTQMVALENMRSRFNSAAGLQSQGYSDVCELPLAVPRTRERGLRRDGGVRRPPQPAVHGRLRDARLGRRRRGRAAGDLAAVGRRRPRRGARPPRVPRPDHHPARR